ncbi:MAG: hypothetical protein V1861_00380 [Candidatus Micrarchaeota archaeon]
MGRTIPSVSYRLEERVARWKNFSAHLDRKEKEALLRLLAIVRERRTAIDAADEDEIALAMLLAMLVYLEAKNDTDGQSRL